MSNTISEGILQGWTVREPDKALIVQMKYDIDLNGQKSSAIQTVEFKPGANLDSLPSSVTDVIGHVWTPAVIQAADDAAAAVEASRLAAFNAAIGGLGQAKSLAEANGQLGLAGQFQQQIDQLVSARDAGQPFEE